MPRQSGYAVTIKGFIPMAKGDFARHAEVAGLLDRGTRKGEPEALTALVGLMSTVEADAKATSKESPESSETGTSSEPEAGLLSTDEGEDEGQDPETGEVVERKRKRA